MKTNNSCVNYHFLLVTICDLILWARFLNKKEFDKKRNDIRWWKILDINLAKERLNGLDQYLEEVLTKRKIPALGISIVADNEIIYSKGFGFSNLEKQNKTTKDTIFPIGSTTKSFTSTTIAMLVEDGLLEWDKTNTRILFGF